MKLSEVLKEAWPIKEIMHDKYTVDEDWAFKHGFNSAIEACDREIDREALAKELYREFFYAMSWEDLDENSRVIYRAYADFIISTMPTWLKRSEKA